MPQKPFSWVPRENLLKFEELFEFIKISIDNGINKIRITGGEPLLREGLDNFVSMIYNYKNDIDLALTTNGYLLKKCAKKLKDAGLKRINVSLDSLKSETAHHIAQKDILKDVLDGIKEAQDVGLKIKVNCVPMQDINDTELIDILEYCKDRDMSVRFIEYMENSFANSTLKGIKSSKVLENISQKYSFTSVEHDPTSPAKYYQIDGTTYKFGIIEPYKDDFCKTCNRIRLTAEGHIIPCLYFEDAMSIKDSIKARDKEKTLSILKQVLANKPEKNKWSADDGETSSRAFYETGG
jgi:cyclic pyranopterin phosphate synthase